MSRMWRVWVWSVVVGATLIFSTSYTAATAEIECKIDLGRGWSSGTGAGKLTVKNNQKRCGDTMYVVPENRIPVDTIQIVKPPQNGTVTIEAPKLFYTPKPGFVGQDRFTLSAEGPADRGRVKLMGEVTVQVNP
jgi:hypothetical protein